jgi:hypothetical protein
MVGVEQFLAYKQGDSPQQEFAIARRFAIVWRLTSL